MRCSKARKDLIRHEESEMPADLRTHLEVCAECRRVQDQMAAVRLLMALKRHERTAPGFEDRCASKIYTALRNEAAPPFLAWVFPARNAWPALRMATLVALMGLIIWQFWAPDLQPLSSISTELADVTPWAIQLESQKPPAVSATPDAFAPPLVTRLLIQAPVSNPGPGRIQYGPVSSQPVSFDY